MSSLSPVASSATAGLNLAQQEAVNYLHGPCLVLAGAGSGKTRVITHKIGRLIQSGLKPDQIAAITFTNKAAAEMRERAKSLIGKQARGVLICTFHALGVRMLRQDGAALGLKPQFSILDSDDVTSMSTMMVTIAGPAAWAPSKATSSGTPMKPVLGKAATSAPKEASFQPMRPVCVTAIVKTTITTAHSRYTATSVPSSN